MNGRHVDIVMIHWKETCVLLSSLLKNHKSVDLKHITIQMSKCNKRKSVSYQRFWMGYLRKGRYQRGDNSAFLVHTFSQSEKLHSCQIASEIHSLTRNKKKCLLWWVTTNIVFLTISTIQLSHVNNVKTAVNNQENQLSNYPRHCRFLQYQHSICQCGWATEAWSENVLQCVALLINYGSATQTQKHKMDHLITCMQAPRTLFWSFRTLIGRLDRDLRTMWCRQYIWANVKQFHHLKDIQIV